MLLLYPVSVISGGDGGLEAGGWLWFFFFFGYQDEYLFWLFHNACQHRACALLITVLPACKLGLFKFFKARFPVGKV